MAEWWLSSLSLRKPRDSRETPTRSRTRPCRGLIAEIGRAAALQALVSSPGQLAGRHPSCEQETIDQVRAGIGLD
jgi:hypothetical protein